ncbi:YjgN family protein [Herbaspirillum sp. RV1423]|uniref:YjgN family protein n=1 Tax=Herbaspirillum sp. RV1423 TaxID=1443993 RepID=UPI0004B83C30|nr:YjgN family protein [Herbaspirillum sp. RV1423]
MSDTLNQPGQPDTGPGFTGAPAAPATEAFSFSGRGSEYFRIWIVNLLLSVVTFGIYSAWAKVRRLRYFYDNTTVAGTSFEYHGNPVAILKGRIIAVVLLFGYQFAFKLNPIVGVMTLIVFAIAVPWLIWRSLQFKLYNSSYRGIRFGFRGNARSAYKVYLLLPVLTLFTLYLLTPFTHQRIKRFQHNESRFGASHFSFDGSVGDFYKTYLIGFGIYIAGLIIIIASFGGLAMIILRSGFAYMQVFFALYVWSFLMYPLFLTLLQNLIWNHTRLDQHRFRSEMRWPRMMFIALTNIIGIIVTLGLFTPFAQIRALRYRIESMSLQPAGNLDEFVADNEAHGSATGEGMTDLLDFDLSL